VLKKIFILVGAGVLSFAGAFAVGWFTNSGGSGNGPETATGQETLKEPNAIDATVVMAGLGKSGGQSMRRILTEKQLKSLIYEVREKIREYDEKLKQLKGREQRLLATQQTIQQSLEELNNLRMELTSTIAKLKVERDKLEKRRIEISQAEKDNLLAIAATYDKMDPTSASKILANMSQGQGGGVEDAVKILYFMSERSRAKLLAEMAGTDPQVAAYFCQRLKQISEKE